MSATRLLLLLLWCLTSLWLGTCSVDPLDAAALRSLKDEWQNTPPSWQTSGDPCSQPWDGVSCDNSRITSLKLSSMGLKGTLSGDIGQLTQLRYLDLSYNNELVGPLNPNIGNLKQLTTLILAGCSFSGSIPDELGTLPQLSFLALNSNKFTGQIPASLGNLSKLYWLDLAANQLTGTLPISKRKNPGLDQLVNTKHFHFNKNQLSGPIPEKLFSSKMTLIHILFDGNQFSGNIPASLGLVQSLEVLRLDKNSLSGSVPPNINNLTKLNEFNLANNKLTGFVPDLTGMDSLNYVDLSNNTFAPTETPLWFSRLQSLTALVVESAGLYGEVPKILFSFPQLQQVILDNNKLNGTLDLGNIISQQLQIVNLQNNQVTSITLGSSYNNTLILVGNPVCNAELSRTNYCNIQKQMSAPYSTSLARCGSLSCPPNQSPNPQSCACAYPYEGLMVFRAPFFRDITNSTIFESLETSLWMKLGRTPGSVSLQNPFFTDDNYLEVQLKLFPSSGMYLSRDEILTIGFDLSNQTYKPPHMFGPYYFIATPYPFPESGGKSSASTGMIVGITVGSALLVIGLVGVLIYALRQKKRAQRATELSKPFASWAPSGTDSGGAPQLKGARWFSYQELKKSTNNFSDANEIGFGGYGKVYRGVFPSGQIVAIKRAEKGSMQGGLEFKTEIELLSRVHHKNLVGLIGFCCDSGNTPSTWCAANPKPPVAIPRSGQRNRSGAEDLTRRKGHEKQEIARSIHKFENLRK